MCPSKTRTGSDCHIVICGIWKTATSSLKQAAIGINKQLFIRICVKCYVYNRCLTILSITSFELGGKYRNRGEGAESSLFGFFRILFLFLFCVESNNIFLFLFLV